VQFEDAHVVHHGGELYPHLYATSRFYYRCGWIVRAGDSLSFLARAGNHDLDYAGTAAEIELAGRRYHLQPSQTHRAARVAVPRTGRVELRVLAGELNLDRMVVSD
jgi:hypothetical protein